MSRLAIETHGLTKDYGAGRGVFALDLEIRPGEVFGFLGPERVGQVHEHALLVGLIRPTGGGAEVLGLDILGQSLAIRRRVGFLAGDFGLYPQAHRRGGARLPGELRGGVDRRRSRRPRRALRRDLTGPSGELSTGNRQKLGLIQAFMHEPELLILDEPIAGLDPLVQQSFHALLGES